MFKQDPAKANGKGKDKSKGKCAPFFQTGVCRYGDKCFFSHDAKDEPAPKGGKGKGKGCKGKRGKRARSAPAVAWDAEWGEDWGEGDPNYEEPWDEVAAWDAEWAAANPEC